MEAISGVIIFGVYKLYSSTNMSMLDSSAQGCRNMHKVAIFHAVQLTYIMIDEYIRCPVEVNLINAYGPWSCTISLRIDFNEYGETLTEPLKIPFGPIITEQDEVDLALRRAQAAILNYRDPRGVHQFLTKTRRELDYYRTEAAHASGTLRFSKNTITLDIQDETRPNLSFVDLPGMLC